VARRHSATFTRTAPRAAGAPKILAQDEQRPRFGGKCRCRTHLRGRAGVWWRARTLKDSRSTASLGPRHETRGRDESGLGPKPSNDPPAHTPIWSRGRSNDVQGVYPYPRGAVRSTSGGIPIPLEGRSNDPQGVYLYPFVQVSCIFGPKPLRNLPIGRHSEPVASKTARKVCKWSCGSPSHDLAPEWPIWTHRPCFPATELRDGFTAQEVGRYTGRGFPKSRDGLREFRSCPTVIGAHRVPRGPCCEVELR